MKNKNKKFLKAGVGIGVLAAVVTPIVVLAVSTKQTKTILEQGRTTLVQYVKNRRYVGDTARVWDLSVQALNMSTREEYNLQLASLFRQKVTQTSETIFDQNGNVVSGSSKSKTEEMTMDAIAAVEVNGKVFVKKGLTVTDVAGLPAGKASSGGYAQFAIEINNAGAKEFKFYVKKGVKYINSKGEKTKYNFKGIDFFYGFMRSIYTSEDSHKGVVGGKKIKPVSAAYLKLLKGSDAYDENGKIKTYFDNGNLYLLNLYGIDIDGTIKANTDGNAGNNNYDEDSFTLKFFKNQSENIVYNFLSDTNNIVPAPSEKIMELNGGVKTDFSKGAAGEPGEFLQIVEYGQRKSVDGDAGVADLSGELKVSRYYIANWDTNPNTEGVVMKMNKHSYDSDYVNNVGLKPNQKHLEKIQFLVIDSSMDSDVLAQTRQKSFLDDNSESILFGEVQEKPTLMNEVKQRGGHVTFQRTGKGKAVGHGFISPWFYIANKENNTLSKNASLLLFGDEATNAKTNPASLQEWFMGRGRIFRTLLNGSVNLYGLTKQWLPDSTKTKTSRNFTDAQTVGTDNNDLKSILDIKNDINASAEDKRFGLEHGILDDQTQKNWFLSQSRLKKGIKELLKPSGARFAILKTAWAKFISDARTSAGIVGDIEVPLLDYRYLNDTADWTKEINNTYNQMVSYLNELTKGTGLKFVKFKSSGSKGENAVNKRATAPFNYNGAGPDYNSIISNIQQYLSAYYGPSPLMAVIAEALTNSNNEVKTYDSNNQNSFDLTSKVSIKDFIDYIKNHSSDFPALAAAIKNSKFSVTLEDWTNYLLKQKFANGNILRELDSAFTKFCFEELYGKQDFAAIKKYTKLFLSLSIGYKLSFGAKNYAMLMDEGFIAVYSSKWFHRAEAGSHHSGITNFIDSFVEVKV